MKRPMVRVHLHPPPRNGRWVGKIFSSMRYLLSIGMIVVGFLVMKYTVKITNIFGKNDFAEDHFSAGLGAGSYTWYRLIGLGILILGTLLLVGIIPYKSPF